MRKSLIYDVACKIDARFDGAQKWAEKMRLSEDIVRMVSVENAHRIADLESAVRRTGDRDVMDSVLVDPDRGTGGVR